MVSLLITMVGWGGGALGYRGTQRLYCAHRRSSHEIKSKKLNRCFKLHFVWLVGGKLSPHFFLKKERDKTEKTAFQNS